MIGEMGVLKLDRGALLDGAIGNASLDGSDVSASLDGQVGR